MSRLSEPLKISPTDPLRELFEACKCGDLTKVRSMVDSTNVNARDTAGRRSTPLHFTAGKNNFNIMILMHKFRVCGSFIWCELNRTKSDSCDTKVFIFLYISE